MNDYVAMASGVVCAGVGGELFVRGAVGVASWARVSPGIIGATVVAFATSSPEMAVSISSALAGTPQIALGDVLGSNVVNIALILALGLLVSGIHNPRDAMKRDYAIALLVPMVTGVLLLDGMLSRFDSCLLLGMFFVWFATTIIEARKQRSAAPEVLAEHGGWRAIIFFVVGLALLVTAGRLIVVGAKGIAIDFGIDEFVVGATIVAVGTSAPELATTIIARLRNHDELSLGTILGSNIFNSLLIVPVAAIIFPIAIDWGEVVVALGFGLLAMIIILPTRREFIGRGHGLLLLVIYGVYLAAIF